MAQTSRIGYGGLLDSPLTERSAAMEDLNDILDQFLNRPLNNEIIHNLCETVRAYFAHTLPGYGFPINVRIKQHGTGEVELVLPEWLVLYLAKGQRIPAVQQLSSDGAHVIG